jgi:uridine kinase
MPMDLDSAANSVIAKINERLNDGRLLVAIDGRSGSGKTTLANLIAEKTGGVVVLGDDFYSGGGDDKWQKYSPEAKVAEVIDWKRLRSQALQPLLAGKPASWHPLAFEPGTGWIGWKDDLITLQPARIVILDGAYSSHPELADITDLSVLVEAPEQLRRQRLLAREGLVFMQSWHQIWDTAEDHYFSQVRPRDSFDLVIRLS